MTRSNFNTNKETVKRTISIFLSEMLKDKKSMWIYCTLVPIHRLINYVLIPLIFSFIVQLLIQNPKNWQTPMLLLGVGLASAIVSAYCGNIGLRRLFTHEEQMSTLLMERAINTLMHQSDQFFADRKVGSISGDVTKFSESIVILLDTLFLNASSIVINFFASLIIITIMSPILLIPLGLVTAFLVYSSIQSINHRRPLRNERKYRKSQLSGAIADILGNQQIVHFFASEKREVARVVEDRQYIEKMVGKEIDIIMRESFSRQIILFAFQVVTMAICIALFATNFISIAAIIFVVTYLGRLTGSLFEITPIIRTTEQAFIDAANITEILDEQVEVADMEGAKKIKIEGGAVKFNSVGFSYRDNDNDIVIDDFTLDIMPGESIGLAGHSGGGKTTLSKLLLRFADVQQGSITIDGQDISEVTQDSLHKAIAYVPQEAYLFHRTLRENIAYGRSEATDEEILHAIKQANASEFVDKLPNGLDTVVGERGVKLSGGQRQRIAIARAILKDAPILVLDEATSALDSASEKLIQESLAKLMKGRTSFVVAHRLSTIAKLDRIIVIDNGKVIEQGSHKELLALGGTYSNLWSHQSGGFIED